MLQRFRIAAAATLLLLLTERCACAFQIFTVGDGCPYTTIQDAVTAAKNSPGEDYVWIVNNKAYSETVDVADQDVDIEGGFTDCGDFTIDGNVTALSAPSGAAIFTIHGNSHVYMTNLILFGASRAGDAVGGAIDFSGTGSLTIESSSIVSNTAGYGAGINVSGGPATLSISHDTLIANNTATVSGGGIRIEGDTRLFVLGNNIQIGGNHANTGYGGGILVLGPARADIGASGAGTGLVSGNHAANGGGIAVVDNNNGVATLRMFADASNRPSAVLNNRADLYGGAIFSTGNTNVCLFAPRIEGNIADDGAAAYHDLHVIGGDYSQDGGIYINGAPPALGADCGPESVAALGGSTACTVGDSHCNLIGGNSTKHADDTPSSGSVIRSFEGTLNGTRFRLQNNIAGVGLYRVLGSSDLTRCLLTDNAVSNTLIYAVSMPRIHVSGCTIANNTIGSGFSFVMYGTDLLQVSYDIFEQPGIHPFYLAGAAVDAGYLTTNDLTGMPTNNPSIVQANPVFVDPTHGDYHLRPYSIGVDFAPVGSGDPHDLDGFDTFDVSQLPNKFGPVDLGAYERQTFFACDDSADVVFCDGFDPY